MDRLRQRADFLAVANGMRMTSPAFVVQRRDRDDTGPVRVGFTVSRKVGSATERNRVRRRLRELVKRAGLVSMRPHSDYVLIGRKAALDRGFLTMLDDLRAALGRLERQALKESRPDRRANDAGRDAPRGAASRDNRPDGKTCTMRDHET